MISFRNFLIPLSIGVCVWGGLFVWFGFHFFSLICWGKSGVGMGFLLWLQECKDQRTKKAKPKINKQINEERKKWAG